MSEKEKFPDISGSDIVLPFPAHGGSCPVQYDIDYQGHNYYVRFRHGYLSVTIDPNSTDERLLDQKISDALDGFWSDEATNVYLALISRAIRDGSLAELKLPAKSDIREHAYYRKGPYRGYDPRNSDGLDRPDTIAFRLFATDGAARLGEIATQHGIVRTPAFMPVGTQATVKGVTPDEVRGSGADIVLANTYHLMLRPGAERILLLGGLHHFMNWPLPIITDSGGFQVMSLSELRKVDEKGVTFRSHLDGDMVELSPERAIEIQTMLCSDIMMQLDECIALPQPRAEIERAMRLSLRWAERSKRAMDFAPVGHGLFGIVQGGDDINLRNESARALIDIGFDGYAIGGLAVGEPQSVMLKVIEEVTPALPKDRPRYLMGVGMPDDLLAAVSRGIDMFDCVLPTRNGRHGAVFTRFGVINLKNARHAADPRPLDESSLHAAAQKYSRAYLHHLVRANEMLGSMLLSAINLSYYQEIMGGIRTAIRAGRFADFCAKTREGWAKGDLPPI